MKRWPRNPAKAWRRKSRVSSPRGVGWITAASLLLVSGAVLLAIDYFMRSQFIHALNLELEILRVEYHLTSDQLRRIRAIELDFHGTGGLFIRPARTQAEARQHHFAISEEMNPQDGASYLELHTNKSTSNRSRPFDR